MATEKTLTRNTEKYCRLAILTAKGCTEILRALVLHQVKLSTPAGFVWTLDDFLNDVLTEENKRKLSNKQQRILYPPGSGSTDIKLWDLSLLALILLDVCKNVDCVVKMDVKKMKDIRNKVCHSGDAMTEDAEFTEYFDQLKVCIKRCLVILGDDDFENEMRALVRDVEHSAISMDESIKILQEWFDSDKRTGEQLERIEQDLQAIKSHSNNTDDNFKMVLTKLDLLIKNSHVSDAAISIPDTPVQLIVKNCGDQGEKMVSDMLVKLIDPKIRNDPELWNTLSGPVYQKLVKVVDEAMKELLSGNRELTDVYKKCVIICIHCPNLESFENLLHQSVSGHFSHVFKPVERAIRELDGYEDVVIEAMIPNEMIWKNLNKLVDDIFAAYGYNQDDLEAELCRSMDATTQEPGSLLSEIQAVEIQPPDNSEDTAGDQRAGTRININIKPRSMDQHAHIVDTCTPGSMRKTLENLALIVRDYYQLKELSIDAKVGQPEERSVGGKLTKPEERSVDGKLTESKERTIDAELTETKERSIAAELTETKERSIAAELTETKEHSIDAELTETKERSIDAKLTESKERSIAAERTEPKERSIDAKLTEPKEHSIDAKLTEPKEHSIDAKLTEPKEHSIDAKLTEPKERSTDAKLTDPKKCNIDGKLTEPKKHKIGAKPKEKKSEHSIDAKLTEPKNVTLMLNL